MYSEITKKSFVLENGTSLENIKIGFHTYGRLNADRSNVIWVCHALTANSDVLDWWSGLFGEGKVFDPDRYFIVCANCLGSCYGTTGPATDSGNGPLLDYFPGVTTRDMARAHDEVRKVLGINSIYTLIGASMGGQQALEWAVLNPKIADNLIVLATNARHSAYGIAFNESQRMAIKADKTFGNGRVDGGKEGLAAARSIALISYRSYQGYVQTQTEESNERTDGFRASSYQQYQGKKLMDRFDAYSYTTLSKAMDSHNLGRGRSTVEKALSKIQARTLVVGVSTDNLFPTNEQIYLANHIPEADFCEIDSNFGHDGFLIETAQLTSLFNDFLSKDYARIRQTVFKTTTKKNELMNLVSKG